MAQRQTLITSESQAFNLGFVGRWGVLSKSISQTGCRLAGRTPLACSWGARATAGEPGGRGWQLKVSCDSTTQATIGYISGRTGHLGPPFAILVPAEISTLLLLPFPPCQTSTRPSQLTHHLPAFGRAHHKPALLSSSSLCQCSV